MFDPAPPPDGSTIERIDEAGDVRLQWQESTMHPARMFCLGVGVLFLVTYVTVIPLSLFIPQGPGMPPAPIPIAVVGVLMGVLFAGVIFGPLLLPRAAESVTFIGDVLNYDTGSPPLPLVASMMFGPFTHQLGATFRKDIPPAYWRRRRHAVHRNDIERIRLERVGERQRLTIDHGADRIEIGTCLREPEREWLAEVLEKWKG